MKKICLSIISLFLIIPLFAQVTGGGVKEQPQQTPNTPQKKPETVQTGLFPKKMGFISVSSFKPDLRVENPTGNQVGFNLIEGSGSGLKLDFGGYRYFAEEIGSPNFNIALYTTFGLAFTPYNWTLIGQPEDPDMSSSPFGFIDYKLGPALSFNIIEGIGADVYFNLGPVVSYGSRLNSDEVYPDKISFGIKTGMGINFRLYKLLVGIHKDMGKMKYSYTDDVNTFEPELSLSQTRFSLGIVF
ncbi:MAG: hypothetical protein Q7J34_02285 [Bacteroidales bacterium]|nr:hypothetical protein [Bacteroidales bacterium]